MHIELQNWIPERMSIFICGSSFPDKVVGSNKKNQNETRIKPCIDEKQDKNKRVAQVAKAQMREKTNNNAFLQCLGPTVLSQEKAPNQSQLADTSSSPPISFGSHCRMENPGSIVS